MARYIDADEFRREMYHEAFETDSDLQKWDSGCWIRYKMFENAIENFPSVDAVPVAHGKWIPFKMRKPDPDELEDHPDWTYVLDGQLPDEGQRILVSCVFKGHEAVQLDEFYTDADGCYLDSGYEIGTEVSAWMPLPEPYKMDEVTE